MRLAALFVGKPEVDVDSEIYSLLAPHVSVYAQAAGVVPQKVLCFGVKARLLSLNIYLLTNNACVTVTSRKGQLTSSSRVPFDAVDRALAFIDPVKARFGCMFFHGRKRLFSFHIKSRGLKSADDVRPKIARRLGLEYTAPADSVRMASSGFCQSDFRLLCSVAACLLKRDTICLDARILSSRLAKMNEERFVRWLRRSPGKALRRMAAHSACILCSALCDRLSSAETMKALDSLVARLEKVYCSAIRGVLCDLPDRIDCGFRAREACEILGKSLPTLQGLCVVRNISLHLIGTVSEDKVLIRPLSDIHLYDIVRKDMGRVYIEKRPTTSWAKQMKGGVAGGLLTGSMIGAVVGAAFGDQSERTREARRIEESAHSLDIIKSHLQGEAARVEGEVLPVVKTKLLGL